MFISILYQNLNKILFVTTFILRFTRVQLVTNICNKDVDDFDTPKVLRNDSRRELFTTMRHSLTLQKYLARE